MKHEGKTQYRFYRPRRPGGIGDGLKLEGMSAWFGLLGIVILMMVGIAMIALFGVPEMEELAPVSIEAQAPAYRTAKIYKSVLIPLDKAQVLALDPAAFAAADTQQLFSLQKGEKLIAWLEKEEAEKWNNGEARKDFYTALLLQKEDQSWLIDYPSYRKKARAFNNQGWWVVLFGLMLIPYQFIKRPKVPFWLSILLFAAAILIWTFIL